MLIICGLAMREFVFTLSHFDKSKSLECKCPQKTPLCPRCCRSMLAYLADIFGPLNELQKFCKNIFALRKKIIRCFPLQKLFDQSTCCPITRINLYEHYESTLKRSHLTIRLREVNLCEKDSVIAMCVIPFCCSDI